MLIADKMIAIHDKENSIVTYDMIVTLDKMLDDHGIKHAFALYNVEWQDNDVAYNLLYREEDEITVELILMLWAKTERHYTDDKIKEMMRRTTE